MLLLRAISVSFVFVAFALGASSSAWANEKAKIFGALPSVTDISLSPDGTKVAFVSPGPGKTTDLYTIDLSAGAAPTRVTSSSGEPESLQWCNWVSNTRLACKVGGVDEYAGQLYGFSNIFAVDADGANPKLLTRKQRGNTIGFTLYGGQIIDWLPDDENAVLMTRYHLEEGKPGTRIQNTDRGLAVERVDTRTGRAKMVERPEEEAVEYITDGEGNVRIMGMRTKLGRTERNSGEIKYFFKADRGWKRFEELNYADRTGFNPYAVDPATNRVFGFQRVDGRKALVAKKLDDSGTSEVIFAHDEVDVDGLIRIGRKNRVVGASYVVDARQGHYFDEDLEKLRSGLAKALSNNIAIGFVDASLDETKLLIRATSDTNPGQYYLFDRTQKKLEPLLGVRPYAEKEKLATVKPISYPAADGTMIPGYLTLPAGSDGKGLAAIVMPHGGPESRDEWGFDWLAQFFASQGFAVVQPNFRGSSGYGDAWYQENGFQSWRTSIGDVTDAGKWLISEGIAKPEALSIVGWSYGGYAALQSAVLAPDLFKAVVAIAPVTDLSTLKTNAKNTYSSAVVRDYVGDGPHVNEGSPARNIDKIKAPILIFHGDYDQNVAVQHARLMKNRLEDAGKPVTYYEYEKLAHSLWNSTIRTDMLTKSAEFLPK
jgi:dipeptidyl aminopeptidase/acylaminoacyl peptidase